MPGLTLPILSHVFSLEMNEHVSTVVITLHKSDFLVLLARIDIAY